MNHSRVKATVETMLAGQGRAKDYPLAKCAFLGDSGHNRGNSLTSKTAYTPMVQGVDLRV